MSDPTSCTNWRFGSSSTWYSHDMSVRSLLYPWNTCLIISLLCPHHPAMGFHQFGYPLKWTVYDGWLPVESWMICPWIGHLHVWYTSASSEVALVSPLPGTTQSCRSWLQARPRRSGVIMAMIEGFRLGNENRNLRFEDIFQQTYFNSRKVVGIHDWNGR